MTMEKANARELPSPYARETTSGTAMKRPKKKIRIAVKRKTTRKCIKNIPT